MDDSRRSVVVLLASCSKDDDNTPQSGNNTNVNGGAVVSFSSNIFASVVVEVTGPGTRAPITALNQMRNWVFWDSCHSRWA